MKLPIQKGWLWLWKKIKRYRHAITFFLNSTLIVALIGSLLQFHHENAVAREGRLIQAWLTTGTDFTCFRMYRDRLDQMALQERDIPDIAKKVDHFYDTKEEYIFKRNECKDKLLADFYVVKHYFNKETAQYIDQFIAWDKQFQMKTISQLPSDDAYLAWQNKIMDSIAKQLPND